MSAEIYRKLLENNNMDNNKTILFIPSNKNHVRIFHSISLLIKKNHRILFVTQGSYKNEGAEDALSKLGVEFKKFEEYDKTNPEFVLMKEKVGVVVIGNDIDIIPQWFANCAKRLRIHTVLIQDGLLFDVNKISKNLGKKLFLILNNCNLKLLMMEFRLIISKQYHRISYGEGGCTQIHVWGRRFQSYIERKGVDKQSLVVTGYLKPSEIRQGYEESHKNTIKTILYSPTDLVKTEIINSKDMRQTTEILCSAVTSLENTKLIIKPHPIEEITFYNAMQTKYGTSIDVSSSDFYDLLRKSDLVITNLSTTSLEALAAGKPVIIFLPNLERIVNSDTFPRDLISRNVMLYAKDKQTLLENIKRILNGKFSLKDSNVNETLEEYLGTRDERAVVRSAESILKLLS